MTKDEDWTREIRERLEKATPRPWYEDDLKDYVLGPDRQRIASIDSAIPHRDKILENNKFIADAPTDIARLLEERDVLREALKFYANEISYVSRQGFLREIRRDRFGPADNAFNPIGTIAMKALAYVPKGLEEKV